MTVRRNTTCSSRGGMIVRTRSGIDDGESGGSAGQVGDRGTPIDAGRPRATGPRRDRQVSSPSQDDREPRFPAAGGGGGLAFRLGASPLVGPLTVVVRRAPRRTTKLSP